MFAHIYQITSLIEKRIGYVKDARANGLGDDKYFADMEKLIRGGLDRLKEQSNSKKLIAKYQKLVDECFL